MQRFPLRKWSLGQWWLRQATNTELSVIYRVENESTNFRYKPLAVMHLVWVILSARGSCNLWLTPSCGIWTNQTTDSKYTDCMVSPYDNRTDETQVSEWPFGLIGNFSTNLINRLQKQYSPFVRYFFFFLDELEDRKDPETECERGVLWRAVSKCGWMQQVFLPHFARTCLSPFDIHLF